MIWRFSDFKAIMDDLSVLRSCNFSPSVQVLAEQFNISNEAQSGLPFWALCTSLELAEWAWILKWLNCGGNSRIACRKRFKYLMRWTRTMMRTSLQHASTICTSKLFLKFFGECSVPTNVQEIHYSDFLAAMVLFWVWFLHVFLCFSDCFAALTQMPNIHPAKS